ncbi:MAG: hypothetical protein O9322_08750 [Beijerinckiaceae bacterium]|nr:hypothetical protein [Beijerinckiaceae bacterium]MCZ8301201.1 hypothetical protein [Beijerinckiaceae bacterium]
MRRLRFAIFLALGCGWSAGGTAQNVPPPPNEIDLKLFDKAEVDRSKGCSLSLWQANRDPENDRFAFIFTERFRGTAHQREAAQIKIGTSIIPLQRVGTGGRSEGYDVYPFQLYKMPDEQGYVVLDLKLEPEQGEAVEISSGKLMVTMLGKLAFRASVKGGVGCSGPPLPGPSAAPVATAPAPAPRGGPQGAPPNVAGGPLTAGTMAPGATAGGTLSASSQTRPPATAQPARPAVSGPDMFERYSVRQQQVPARFLQGINQRFGCTVPAQRNGITGFQMSEESAIWQIPCDRFGQNQTSVFALVYLPAPDQQYEILETPSPRGLDRKLDSGVLMSAQWDVRSRTVTSLYPASDRQDCGIFERHAVTREGKLALVEFREKTRCDGVAGRPDQWPLVFGRR